MEAAQPKRGPLADTLDGIMAMADAAEARVGKAGATPKPIKITTADPATIAQHYAAADAKRALGTPPPTSAENPASTPFAPVKETEPDPNEVAAILEKVSAFLSDEIGPIFISTPIRRKIFVGRYPRLRDLIDARKVVRDLFTDEGGEQDMLISVIAELTNNLYGYLHENDPKVELIHQHESDPTKWPEMKHPSFLLSKDPNIVQAEILPLWEQWLAWKVAVTPSEDDFEKYYALAP